MLLLPPFAMRLKRLLVLLRLMLSSFGWIGWGASKGI